MSFLSNVINNSTFYYVAVAVLYVLVIAFVIFLIVNNKRKKVEKFEVEEINKKDVGSVDLESVLDKMQEEVNKAKTDEVKSFEEEQEEKAIISYQELLKAVKKNVDNVTKEVEKEKDVLENKVEDIPVVIKEDKNVDLKNEEKTTKFQSSEFISPIYGRVNNDIKYPKIPVFHEQEKKVNTEEELEKTIVFEAIKDDNSDEFLKALKEFRNNLE